MRYREWKLVLEMSVSQCFETLLHEKRDLHGSLQKISVRESSKRLLMVVLDLVAAMDIVADLEGRT